MTVAAGDTDEEQEVVMMGGGIGAEFGDVDIYGDVEEEEEGGMRRECGLTVDGMSDATFNIFPSMRKPSLCVRCIRRLACHSGKEWRVAANV